MILDNLNLFSDQQAITATANSTNSIDLGAPGIAKYNQAQLKRRLAHKMVPLMVLVTQTFDNLTSLKIILQSDDDSAFGSPKEVASTTVLLADLKAGFYWPVDKLPRNITERYIRMRYEVTGTAPTAGKISAGVVGAVDGGYQGNV